MASNYIYTKKIWGLDKNILFTLLAVIILSTGLLAYKAVNNAGTKPCEPISITITDVANISRKVFNSEETLLFKAPISAGNIITWNFGDGTAPQIGFTVHHTYKNAGTFSVTASSSSVCDGSIIISVKKAPSVPFDSSFVSEPIIGTDETNVGINEKFSASIKAEFYEWSIENNGNYAVRYGKETYFKFKTPGKYTIALVLDRNSMKKYTKTVVVSDITKFLETPDNPQKIESDYIPPPPPKPEEKPATQPTNIGGTVPENKPPAKAPEKKFLRIADGTFRDYLQAVVCGGFEMADFDKYLCSGGATNVQVNESSSLISFSKLCADIKNKKIKIDEVETKRDDNKCVILIKVSYDKKGWLGGNPCN